METYCGGGGVGLTTSAANTNNNNSHYWAGVGRNDEDLELVVRNNGGMRQSFRQPRIVMHAEVMEKRSFNCAASSSSNNHLAPKPLRRCRSASPAAAIKAPLLTSDQQNLIRKSWQRVSKSLIGRTIYEHMIEKCADTKIVGDLTAIGRHERYFVDLVQSAVDNITDMDVALRPWLETIGTGHTGFAIKSKHWDAFGEALTSAIAVWVGPGKTHKETVRSWRLLFSFIADRLGSALRTGAAPCATPRIQLLTLVNGPSTPP